MKLTKEIAETVDEFLTELQTKYDTNRGATLTILEYLQIDGNVHKFENDIIAAFNITDYVQKIKGFKVYQLNLIDNRHHIDFLPNITDPFLENGGFLGIWQIEENERLEKKRIDDSIVSTNKVQRFSLYLTAVVLIFSAWIQWEQKEISKRQLSTQKTQDSLQIESLKADSLTRIYLTEKMSAIQKRLDSIEKKKIVSP